MGYDLVATAGPVEGERFSLPNGEEVLIGRTSRGVNLPDPMVSVKHARLVEEKGRWTITDLNSATGTQVNGVELVANTPTDIDVGDEITIGETILSVDSGQNRAVRRLLWAAAPAWLIVFLAGAVLWWVSGEGPENLTTNQDIRLGSGVTRVLSIPKPFVRRHDMDVRKMTLRRVTDRDQNGIDELWLYLGDDEIVITFNADNGWVLLGRVPQGCVDRGPEGEFPDLSCDGIDYRLIDGEYRAVAQIDPVVWLTGTPQMTYELEPNRDEEPAPASKAKSKNGADGKPRVTELGVLTGAKGPVAFRISMGSVDQLAGFLSSQGITEPVHYVICENGFSGVPAQALLQGGRVRRLAFGCASDVGFKGVRSPAFEGAQVAAFALTATGRDLLPKHLAYTWSGAPEPLFVPAFYRGIVEAASEWPIPIKGGVYLAFESAGHVFHPIASEPFLPSRIRLEAEDALEVEAVTASLLTPGRADIDVDGCSNLTVRTRSFRCALMRGCLPGAQFIEVVEQGCGKEGTVVARHGYTSGASTGSTADVEVRIEVETQSGMAITDVMQARVGARPAE